MSRLARAKVAVGRRLQVVGTPSGRVASQGSYTDDGDAGSTTPFPTEALAERFILWTAASVLFVQQMLFSRYTVDDAYISFRYARNLASGLGLVYNVGERVEGYTNFLWTLLMAGGFVLGFDPVAFAKALGVVASLCTICLLYRFSAIVAAPSALRWRRTVACLLLAGNGAFATASITGLETSLFTLLVTAGAYYYVRGQLGRAGEARPVPWWRPRADDLSAVCFALSAMTRPEGAIVFGFGLLMLLTRGLKRSTMLVGVRSIAIYAALYLPYYMWRFSYYGYPFPNTYYAKTGAGMSQLAKGMIDLGAFSGAYYAFLFPPALFLLMGRRSRLSTPATVVLTALYGVVAALGVFSPIYCALLFLLAAVVLIVSKAPQWIAYVGGLTVLYAGVTVYEGGDWIPFFRMIVPVVPLYYLLLQEGLARAWALLRAQIADAWTAERWRKWAWERQAFATWTVIVGLIAITMLPSVGMVGRLNALAAGYRSAHGELAQWLKQNARGPIALMDIGLIGYVTDFAIIDTSGLTDAYVAHMPGGLIDKRFDFSYILAREPEFVVLASGSDFMELGGEPTDFPIDRRIYAEPRFKESYRHLTTLDEGWRENGKGYFLAVFQRRR